MQHNERMAVLDERQLTAALPRQIVFFFFFLPFEGTVSNELSHIL